MKRDTEGFHGRMRPRQSIAIDHLMAKIGDKERVIKYIEIFVCWCF
jgi:hypothetical protein